MHIYSIAMGYILVGFGVFLGAATTEEGYLSGRPLSVWKILFGLTMSVIIWPLLLVLLYYIVQETRYKKPEEKSDEN